MVQSSNVAVREVVVDQIAQTRGRSRDFIVAQIEEAGGDLEIDSREAETVVARCEVVLGLPEIHTERQGRRQRNTVSSLTKLIERELATNSAATRRGGQ